MAEDKILKVGVIGATGAVGIEMVNVLHEKNFPTNAENVTLFASERSAGKKLETPYGEKEVVLFSVEAVRQMDYVFMAVSGGFSKKYAKEICEGDGPVVIDNSSAWRYEPDVALVVPEINAHACVGQKLIANPNCTTAIAAMALWPIHRHFGLQKVIVSTYQASSGAGAEGMEELETGIKNWANGEPVENKVFAYPLPFNVIPHIDAFQENGFTKEEMKVVWETQKIFGDDKISASCTAVRIPTLRAHSEAITIQTHLPITPAAAREVLEPAPGLEVVDDPENKKYPMPLNATRKNDVEVGRIRQSLVFGENGLDFFVSGDQLLRGAALNAVLIGEAMVKGQTEKQDLPYLEKLEGSSLKRKADAL
eukprot:CAMPEP_0113945330 /NCGR_PEP_ID=MMETSP1339-20121228/44185_1 /TAXON_ID=94617 /ORGANISM="Fibrocapsa japonica" /LENGTH=365 /DNA_ID=CAMNT_0000950861 /DNA_START=46 /DNA_END=1143 /DNA_ORIENTATION=- /assembly_acc=CAM_ASM_000762